jgi:hypothetical protein
MISEFIQLPTSIYGLSFFPQMKYDDMDSDAPLFSHNFHGTPEQEISDLERNQVEKITTEFRNRPINIMEIGVCRNDIRSFTHILLNKHPESKYIGIDFDDKSFLNDPDKYILTIQTNSLNQDGIRQALRDFSMIPLSILFIDGWHSVNMTINDWRYAEFVHKGGYIIMHDAHMHPGPQLLLQAIDRSKFDVKIPLEYIPGHYGITIIKKL